MGRSLLKAKFTVMFMQLFLDNPILVAWGIILLTKSIHCCHEGMHLIGNDVHLSYGIQMVLHFYQGAQCVP